MNVRRSLCLMLLLHGLAFINAPLASASDWLRFRGPNGSGMSNDAVAPPVKWSPSENLKWKTPLPGPGVSCPIVVGDKCFVTCYSGYGVDGDVEHPDQLKRHLVCVDRNNGDILWQKTVPAVLPEDPYVGAGVPQHGYASHTPVSDGERVYVFFGKTGAFAFDLEGNQLWHTSLGTESDDRRWGSASSPILYRDVLIVTAGAECRAIVGLDKMTGKEKWRAEAEGLGMVWGTPIVTKNPNGEDDLVIGAPYEIWGINPDTGKLHWFCEAIDTESYSSSLTVQDNVVYGAEGRSGGSIAMKPGGEGDVTASSVVWSGRDASRFSTPLVYEGRMYLISSGIIACVDAANGEQIFRGRLKPGNRENVAQDESRGGFRNRFGSMDYSSPVLSHGKIYYVSRSGDIHVIDAGDELNEVATNRVTAESEDFSATPAISDGEIFIRSDKHLYCVAQ